MSRSTFEQVHNEIYGNGGNASNVGNAGNAPMSARDLLALDLPAVRWAIPDILPAGVTLPAGKPKLGKSWLGLSIVEAIAAGGVAFGVKPVEAGDTLYLALEDNYRRLQSRLRKVLEERDAPEGMFVHTKWPRLGEGGADALDEWLEDHPSARLVVIDTLKKIRPRPDGKGNKSVYDLDYDALEALLPLAAEHNVSILVVHHTRKAMGADPIDEISGSFGLTGGVDGFLVMRRDGGGKGVSLSVDGRDIEEPKEYALARNLNTGTWTIEGEAEEVRISKERSDVLLMIRRHGPQTPKELAELLNVKPSTMRKRLLGMVEDGQVIKGTDDKYRTPDMGPDGNGGNAPGNGGNVRNTAWESQVDESVTSVTDDTLFSGNAKSDRLSEEQAEEIKRLREEGMGAKQAREEVLRVRR